MPAPKHREGFARLEQVLRKYTSLADLEHIARRHGVTLKHVKDVLKGNKTSNAILRSIIDRGVENKNRGLSFADWRRRSPEVDVNQAYFDFFPSAVPAGSVSLNRKED